VSPMSGLNLLLKKTLDLGDFIRLFHGSDVPFRGKINPARQATGSQCGIGSLRDLKVFVIGSGGAGWTGVRVSWELSGCPVPPRR